MCPLDSRVPYTVAVAARRCGYSRARANCQLSNDWPLLRSSSSHPLLSYFYFHSPYPRNFENSMDNAGWHARRRAAHEVSVAQAFAPIHLTPPYSYSFRTMPRLQPEVPMAIFVPSRRSNRWRIPSSEAGQCLRRDIPLRAQVNNSNLTPTETGVLR